MPALEGVPQLTLHKATELRRLITAVDAFYDAQVLLVVTAAVAPADLFLAEGADSHADKFGDVIGNIVQDSGDEAFAWRRTLSRLQEMRSEAYVSRARRRKGLKQGERRETARRLEEMAMQGFDFAAFAALCQEQSVGACEVRLRELFEQADLDRSGTLDAKEIRRALDLWNIPIDDDKLAELISACDFDGDGQVDYKEVRDAALNVALGTATHAAAAAVLRLCCC